MQFRTWVALLSSKRVASFLEQKRKVRAKEERIEVAARRRHLHPVVLLSGPSSSSLTLKQFLGRAEEHHQSCCAMNIRGEARDLLDCLLERFHSGVRQQVSQRGL